MDTNNYFEIDKYVITIAGFYFAEISIHSKEFPQVIFKIRTKFLKKKLDYWGYSEMLKYLHFSKFPSEYQMHQFEVKKVDGLIFIHNIEAKMRICRITVDFMNEVIDKCNKLVAACLNEPRIGIKMGHEDKKTISIGLNSSISFGLDCDSNLMPGYLSFSDEGRYLADWMTLLEYDDIPNYEISAKKCIGSLQTVEV